MNNKEVEQEAFTNKIFKSITGHAHLALAFKLFLTMFFKGKHFLSFTFLLSFFLFFYLSLSFFLFQPSFLFQLHLVFKKTTARGDEFAVVALWVQVTCSFHLCYSNYRFNINVDYVTLLKF